MRRILTAIGTRAQAIPQQRRPHALHRRHRQRALAALSIAGTMWAAFAAAGDPASKPTAAAAAAAQPAATTSTPAAAVAPMRQETLLERQSRHPENLFVLDVRTPQEYAQGHLPGAVNVPYDQLSSRLAEVPKDKDIVLYCRSGRRTGLAADVLASNGYSRLSHLEGDMNAWVEKGRPVEKP